MDRSTTEWAVLGLVAEAPTHGFAVARELRAEADVGRIWSVSRPLVYRAITALERAGAVVETGRVPGEGGPSRQLIATTDRGRTDLAGWLGAPVLHVRDLRAELLLKLAFLDRAHDSPEALLAAQAKVLDELVDQLESRAEAAEGFDRTLLTWRVTNAAAARTFVELTLHPG